MPTVTTAAGSKNIGEGIQAFLRNVDTFAYSMPTVTTTAGLGKKVYEYLQGLDTNVTLQATAQTGLGAAVQNFIKSLGSSATYTGLVYDTKVKGSLAETIQNFIRAIGVFNYEVPAVTTATGVGSKVQTAINSIVNATYSTPAINVKSGVGLAVQGVVNAIASSSVYTRPALSTSTGAVSVIQSYITGISGVSYTTPALATNTGPGKRIQDYINSLNTSTVFTAPTLSATAGLGKSIQGYIDAIKNTLTPAIGGIADVFTAERANKIGNFKAAVESLDTAGSSITSNKDVLDAVSSIIANGDSAANKIGTLSTRLAALSTTLNPLLDSISGKTVVKGQLSLVADTIAGLAKSIQDAWNSVQFKVETNLGDNLDIAVSNAGLSSGDSKSLTTIASNTSKYPVIKSLGAAGYEQATFKAEGGYIQGPGSNTSDSIPARLSNGEYVIKASSTRRLGKRLLDTMNSTGDVGAALSKEGRRGDTLLAHINPQEAALLKRLGGSGSINPTTGLLEFFNADAGAFGGIFQKQEIDKLYADHQAAMPSSIQPSNLPGFIRMDTSGSGAIFPYNPGQIFKMFGGDSSKAKSAMRLAGNALSLADRSLEAREDNALAGLSLGIGANNAAQNNIVANFENGNTLSVPNAKVGSGPSTRGGYGARPNQLLAALAEKNGETVSANSSTLSKDAISKYVTGLNKGDGKLFFDFFMLQDPTSASPVRTSMLGSQGNQAQASSYTQSYKDGKYFESVRVADSLTNSAGAYTYLEDVKGATSAQIENPFSLKGATAGKLEGAGVGIFAPTSLFGRMVEGTTGFSSQEELNSYIVSLVGGSGSNVSEAISKYVEQLKTKRVNEILSGTGLSAVEGETFDQSIQRLIAKRTQDAVIAQEAERARLAALSEAQRQLEARISEVYFAEIGQTIGSADLAKYVSQLNSGSTTLDSLKASLNNSAAGKAWDLRQIWQPVYDSRVSVFNPNPRNFATMDGRPALASLDQNWNLRDGKTADTLKADVANYWKVVEQLALAGPKPYNPPSSSGIGEFVGINAYVPVTTMEQLDAMTWFGSFSGVGMQGLYEPASAYTARARQKVADKYGANSPMYDFLASYYNLNKYAAGGLVGNGRDRIPALLEPGEFVLRKQAVDSMGIDNAIRLNSTGNAGNGDVEVEVNINNNGTSQTAVGTPEVRRVNGKIVVDIILEDLRNNGPINRQIRSIR
jgi:hypothetical protein